MSILLEEFDPSPRSIIEPEMLAKAVEGFPDTAVTCFAKGVIDRMLEIYGGRQIARLLSDGGGVPVYEVRVKDKRLAVYQSQIGAPVSTIQMEEIIAMGADKFVVFGSCGCLCKDIAVWHFILPTAALRDEGTSYHYAPPANEIPMQHRSLELLKRVFERHCQPYITGKVWTTDAFFRETPDKTRDRGEQGCLVVDMECAALNAVARFRKVKLAQFFYGEDNLDGPVWDGRGLSKGVRTIAHLLLELAFDCALEL